MALGPQNMQGPAFSVEDLCTFEPLPEELSNQLATWQAAQEKNENSPGSRMCICHTDPLLKTLSLMPFCGAINSFNLK